MSKVNRTSFDAKINAKVDTNINATHIWAVYAPDRSCNATYVTVCRGRLAPNPNKGVSTTELLVPLRAEFAKL